MFSGALSGGESLGKGALGLGGAAALLGGMAAIKPYARVPEGHVALIENFDKVKKDGKGRPMPNLVTEGVHFKPSFKGALRLVDVRKRTLSLGNIPILVLPPEERQKPEPDISKGKLWNVKASVDWRVFPHEEPAYRSLYRVESGKTLDDMVLNICSSGLTEALNTVSTRNLRNSSLLDAMVYNSSSDELHEYGVELEKLRINEVSPDRIERVASLIASLDGNPAKQTLVLMSDTDPDLGIAS